ncbi:IS66 family transposase [Sulfitobacter faviae]|uniref:IS66 family transposase n=1 Tax=Sulfitobacter faviae TaxID=1775881 RepID=UPI00398CC4CB
MIACRLTVQRIGAPYRIEADIHSLGPADRLTEMQGRSAPIIRDFKAWLILQCARVARKSPLGEALAYITKYWGQCRRPMQVLGSSEFSERLIS